MARVLLVLFCLFVILSGLVGAASMAVLQAFPNKIMPLLPPDVRIYFETQPIWARYVDYAAVGLGPIGAILLLARVRSAATVSILALFAVCASYVLFYTYEKGLLYQAMTQSQIIVGLGGLAAALLQAIIARTMRLSGALG